MDDDPDDGETIHKDKYDNLYLREASIASVHDLNAINYSRLELDVREPQASTLTITSLHHSESDIDILSRPRLSDPVDVFRSAELPQSASHREPSRSFRLESQDNVPEGHRKSLQSVLLPVIQPRGFPPSDISLTPEFEPRTALGSASLEFAQRTPLGVPLPEFEPRTLLSSPRKLSPSYSVVSLYPIFGKLHGFPFEFIPSLFGERNYTCSTEITRQPIPAPCPSSTSPQITASTSPPPEYQNLVPIVEVQRAHAPKNNLETIPSSSRRLELISKKLSHRMHMVKEDQVNDAQQFSPTEEYHQFPEKEFKEWLDSTTKFLPGLSSTDERSTVDTRNMLQDQAPKSLQNEIPGTNSKNKMPESPSIFNKIEVRHPGLDLKEIQGNVRGSTSTETKDVTDRGIAEARRFLASRSKVIIKGEEVPDFVDYFTRKDGYIYIGTMESFFVAYYEKTQRLIRTKEYNIPGSQKRSEEVRRNISQIYKSIAVNEEKDLQDYDFPATLERDVKVFDIDYMAKVVLVAKCHNYGVYKILHYIKLLLLNEAIPPINIYTFATELLADIVILCYGIFIKICDFLVQLITEPTEGQLSNFTSDRLIRSFRHLFDSICDEIGAIGQSCSQILLRVKDLERSEILETLTNIYTQVNYASTSISRAMESMAPAIHYFCLKYFL